MARSKKAIDLNNTNHDMQYITYGKNMFGAYDRYECAKCGVIARQYKNKYPNWLDAIGIVSRIKNCTGKKL